MPTHQFYQLDVFTSEPLTGNPLAVFPDAQGITADAMQALAREMNLSETVFVTASEVATRRVRFFTPAAEIPVAGHPTVGTWWLLAERGDLDLPDNGVHRIAQETGAGVLPVDIHMTNAAPSEVVMIQPLPDFGAMVPERERLAEVLGGEATSLPPEPLPQIVSTGLPQLMVPMTSLSALRSLPSGGAGGSLASFLTEAGTDCAMCYSLQTEAPEANVHCRMFAPGLGVPEDPATGSAAGALASYLVWHGIVRPHDGVATVVVEQGIEIGRASRIHVEIAVGNGGEITEVRVGGTAVTIISGEVRL
jgi:trans-2,3-dihydro-3-hydroxyanthranilate isomerase